MTIAPLAPRVTGAPPPRIPTSSSRGGFRSTLRRRRGDLSESLPQLRAKAGGLPNLVQIPGELRRFPRSIPTELLRREVHNRGRLCDPVPRRFVEQVRAADQE